MNKTLLYLVSYLHILFWIFIMFGGFISKRIAEFNIYILIPLTYISHLFPYHPLNTLKTQLAGSQEKLWEVEGEDKVINLFQYITKRLFQNAFINPLTPQGMMIFGFITSIYALKYNLFLVK